MNVYSVLSYQKNNLKTKKKVGDLYVKLEKFGANFLNFPIDDIPNIKIDAFNYSILKHESKLFQKRAEF